DGSAALASDGGDAHRARTVAQRERADGVEDHVGVVLAGRGHDLVRSLYMERLSYIDEFATRVDASPERTWDAVARAMRAQMPGWNGFARVLGTIPASSEGDWRADDPTGATTPGFEVVAAQRPTRLELRGRHRFASYALVFQIDEESVRARTYAT